METNNNRQAGDGQLGGAAAEGRENWNPPAGGHVPDPSYMPVILAVGVMCMLWGIVTTYLITLVGVALFAVALTGWIGELRHEHRHS